jgi:pullulanase-type alpha-1,6-glucosidase
MVQSLNQNGLRLVMDVVYNHTNAAGQTDFSVLDRIVPGYYHRLNATGDVERSTCCANTATEHNMMRKLMVDSVLTWAEAYKVDGFRFDLMGHHMREDMLAVRGALDGLTTAVNGVDGQTIYLYGEGWNFGEVADNARGINATQLNMGGTGIGTFNDRIRDAIRGGNPFGDYQKQGFSNGLYFDPNETDQGSEAEQLARLLELSDHIRVGLAGNLKAFEFIGASGEPVTGEFVFYNGSPAGYTEDPQENINYTEAHDNETLFDAILYKAPLTRTPGERAQMQNMALSLVMLGQGVPFFHAGGDMLRSKNFDRDSFNSGDWFNRLDFTYAGNNFGSGLPVASKNQENWPLQQPFLANPANTPDQEAVLLTVNHFREMLQIRRSSPLFRLQTAEQITARLQFHNTGPEQIPGLIVMSLDERTGEDLDPNYDQIVVLFNANDEAQTFTIGELAGMEMMLHPVLAASSNSLYTEMAYDVAAGTFTVPGRSTAVFVQPQTAEAAPTATATAEPTEVTAAVETSATSEPTTAPETVEETADETGFSIWLVVAGVGVMVVLIVAWSGRRRK